MLELPGRMSVPARTSLASAATGTFMVRIPEGWFWMGSESGQDNERPWQEGRGPKRSLQSSESGFFCFRRMERV